MGIRTSFLWRHFIRHIDEADRLSFLFGASVSYLWRSNVSWVSLLWQTPLGAIVFVALIRLIDSPFRVMEEASAREARAKEAEGAAKEVQRRAEHGLPTFDKLVERIIVLEEALKGGRFDINIVNEVYSEPRFYVIAGPVQNPSHRHSADGDFSLRQYRAYLTQFNLANSLPPPEFQIITQVSVSIYAVPKMLVEQMELELMNVTYPCINWKSEYMLTDYVRDLEFVIPDSVTPGIHKVRIIATVNGEQRYSAFENVNFPER